MKILQVFRGDEPLYAEPVEIPDESTVTFRLTTGAWRDQTLRALDVDVAVREGAPVVVGIRSEQLPVDESPKVGDRVVVVSERSMYRGEEGVVVRASDSGFIHAESCS